MRNKLDKPYTLILDGKLIGTTYFEKADAAMGVVMGRVHFSIDSPYRFIRDYCKEHSVPLNTDDPENEAVFTQSIEGLKILTEKGCEIIGVGATISGFAEEGYYIDVFGIPYPVYEEEFPHHMEAYDKQFD